MVGDRGLTRRREGAKGGEQTIASSGQGGMQALGESESEGFGSYRNRRQTLVSASGRDAEQVVIQDGTTGAYDSISENGCQQVADEALSTFSIDVDTASYANVRRFLRDERRPPEGAVRIEELINYFPYEYAQPEAAEVPFAVTTDVTRAPWDPSRLLARIGLQGREIAKDALPASNLVFLIDVSGSMQSADKLPLLKRSLLKLVEELREGDRVAIVTYAGASGLALESTDAADKTTIREAIEQLGAGGSTNGAAGIRQAHDTARMHFFDEGNNRVILCTDGDFNVGTTSRGELEELIEKECGSAQRFSSAAFMAAR